MRVLCCGDRHWNNYQIIRDYLSELPKDTIVLYKNAKGADSYVDRAVGELGLKAHKLLANWDNFGFTLDLLPDIEREDLRPDLILAFHNNLTKSRGTAGIINKARKCGIKVEIIGAW